MSSKDKTPKPPKGGKKPRVEPTIGKTDTPAAAGTPPTTDASAEVTVKVEAKAKPAKSAKPRVRVNNGESADEAVKRERRKVLFSKSDVKSLGDASEEIVTRGGRPIFWALLILVGVFFLCWMLRDVGASWLSRQPSAAATAPSVVVPPPNVTVNPPDVSVTVNNPPPAPPVVEAPKPPATKPPVQAPPQTPPSSTLPPAVGESLRPPGMRLPPGEQSVPLPPSARSQVTKTECLILKPFPRSYPNDRVRFDFKNKQICYVTSQGNAYQPASGCVPYARMNAVQKRLYDQYAAVYAKSSN